MDLISRQRAIDVEGLDEQIRCEMCRNPMHTDRGCDGNCKYDEKLYERIMQILGERIKPLPSVQSELCNDAISRQAAINALANYIHNIDKVCGMGKLLSPDDCMDVAKRVLDDLPSVQPTYTEAQLQKMQDLEQAQFEKVFDIGREDARTEIIYCGECKHADYARKDILGRIYCMNHGFYWDALAYCSYAERRTNETD